jgi:hypothetical protein
MPNNNAVRRILAKRLGLAKGASWGDIRRETHRIKRDLGLPRGTSISAICRRVAEDRWFQEAYNRLQDQIYGRMLNEGDREVGDICYQAVLEVRHQGLPALETTEEFFRLVLGITTMVSNYLTWFRLDPGDVPLEEKIYLLLAYDTRKGLEEIDLERFREYEQNNSVPELFRLDLNEDNLPTSMVGMRPRTYYLEDEDTGRYSFSDEEEDDFLFGPLRENYLPEAEEMRQKSLPDMGGCGSGNPPPQAD